MKNDSLSWVAAGSAIGAMFGGLPGAGVGFVVGALAHEFYQTYCDRCKVWMKSHKSGAGWLFVCESCGRQIYKEDRSKKK